MPQVQVLPGIQSFGERLAPAIGQGVENFASAYKKRQADKLDKTILEQLNNDPNLSDMDKIAKISQLSLEKQSSFIPLYSQVLQQQNTLKIQHEQFQNRQLQDQLKQQAKQEQEQIKDQQENADALEIVNELADKLEQGDVGFWNYYNKLSSKGRENRAYFDELALGIEQRLVQKVGKGSLNMQRFAYLKSLLPSSSDSDATNRGKLKALAKEFKGEISKPSSSQEESPSTSKEEAKSAKRPSLEEIFG